MIKVDLLVVVVVFIFCFKIPRIQVHCLIGIISDENTV